MMNRIRLIFYKNILFQLDNFASFVDELKKIVEEEDLNLLNATIRYTKALMKAF